MPDDDEDMPDVDEDSIRYFRHDNPNNEKPDFAEDSFDDGMPNIDPYDITYFRHDNPDNSFPNIDPNQIADYRASLRKPKLISSPYTNNMKRSSLDETYLSEETQEESTDAEKKELLNVNDDMIPEEMQSLVNNELEIDERLEPHRKFLDYIKIKYSNKKWGLDISEEEVVATINDFGNTKGHVVKFYKKIVKFAPTLISDNTSKTKAELARKLKIPPDGHIIRYVLPYLNSQFAKKREKILSEETVNDRARKMNLQLLSNYEKEYKNQNSILRWLCLKCKYIFPESLYNLEQYIIPCSNCRVSVKDARGVRHHKIPEYLKERVAELIKMEVEKYKKGEPHMSLPEVHKSILKEFPNELISVHSVRDIAITAAKIRDIGTGEILNYYDLIWGRISKYIYEDAVEVAKDTGLKVNNIAGSLVTTKVEFGILTEKTSPAKAVLTWSCNKMGHKHWPARFDMIIYGQWCPKCFAERVGQIYDDFVELARRRGVEENNVPGTLVTTRDQFKKIIEKKNTPPSKAVLTWICNTKKHKAWDTIPNSIEQGSWCPYCSEGKYESIYRENIESVFNIPFSKVQLHTLGTVPDRRFHFDCSGELLVINDELILGRNSVKLNLNNGLLMLLNKNKQNLFYQHHQRVYFVNDYDDRQQVLEIITQDFLSQNILAHEGDIILIEFPYGFLEFELLDNLVTLKSKVLKEVSSNINLSSNKLKIASEYNGPQHYYFPNPFHRLYNDFPKDSASFMRFLAGRCNDLFRKYFSNKNDIILIEFPYWVNPRMNNPQIIQKYIIMEFQSKTGIDLTNLS